MTFLFIITGFEDKTNMCVRLLAEENFDRFSTSIDTCGVDGRNTSYAVLSRCVSEGGGIVNPDGGVNKARLRTLIVNSADVFIMANEKQHFLDKVSSLNTWENDLGKYCSAM